MNKPITIAYFTCRKEPKIEWFFYSLNRELKGDWSNIQVLLIDYYHQFNPGLRTLEFLPFYERYTDNVSHISPKPTVWQGKYKKTTNEYFAASNSRNTAFVNCTTDYLVCIDDLTVVKEGWWDTVKWGQDNNYVLLGAYAKANELVCQGDGSYSYKEETLHKGLDSRYNNEVVKHTTKPVKVAGSWLYGCSFSLPLELALKIDGFDEACDGQGAEDYDFGIRLGRVTSDIYYCKEMFTYENDEMHSYGNNQKFIRSCKTIGPDSVLKKYKGTSSDHAMLKSVMDSNSPLPVLPSYLKEKDSSLRLTDTDWRDGQLLSEM